MRVAVPDLESSTRAAHDKPFKPTPDSLLALRGNSLGDAAWFNSAAVAKAVT